MTEKSKANPILGISDTETVKLDLDDISFCRVKYWAFRAMRWFKLQGFIILRSSKNCYHVIFDRTVSWTQNMSVVAGIALLSHNEGLKKYHLMQCIKKCSTVRVSSKKEKPSPRIVYRFGSQNQNIREFLRKRKLIARISTKYTEKP